MDASKTGAKTMEQKLQAYEENLRKLFSQPGAATGTDTDGSKEESTAPAKDKRKLGFDEPEEEILEDGYTIYQEEELRKTCLEEAKAERKEQKGLWSAAVSRSMV